MVEAKTTNKYFDICGIIVTYNPNEEFAASLLSACEQLSNVIVVDNSDQVSIKRKLQERIIACNYSSIKCRIHYIPNSHNYGLARAYNQGIAKALSLSINYCIFLDQDSVLLPRAIENLWSNYITLNKQYKVGALNCVNIEPIKTVFDQLTKSLYLRLYSTNKLIKTDLFEEIYININSGLFISIDILKEIGYFDETHFIDSIDHEFSLRLLTYNYKSFRVLDAKIEHSIGYVHKIGIRNRIINVRLHSRERDYYIARDTKLTIKKYYKQFPLISFYLSTSLLSLLIVSIMLHDRKLRIRQITKGLFS